MEYDLIAVGAGGAGLAAAVTAAEAGQVSSENDFLELVELAIDRSQS